MNNLQINNKLYHNLNLEWHKQFNYYTKFISIFSYGLSTFSSRFTISRNIDYKTSIDISLYFNFFHNFWNTFWKLFKNKNKFNNQQQENAADLFDNIFPDNNNNNNNNNNKSYLYVIPELFTVFKNGIISIYNFLTNSKNVIINNIYDNNNNLYPGFDISFGIRRIIFNEWMGISTIRLGQSPSFSWNILKNIGSKHWNFQFDFGKNGVINLLLKHDKSLEKTLKFYCSLGFDMTNIIKFECGFDKLLIDSNLEEMLNEFKNKDNNNNNNNNNDDDNKYGYNIISNIDINTLIGINISLRQGISFKLCLKRGVSQLNFPIKLTESPSSLKQILLSFTIPIITYFGYKLYFKQYSIKLNKNKIKQTLNDKGLSLFNKREFALKQQSIMTKESNKSLQIEKNKNGLIILLAFYGVNVENKLFDAIRKYLNLDQDDDDNDDNDNDDNDDDDNDNENKQEEKNEYEASTNNGPPPLLFDIYNNKDDRKEKEKEKKVNNNNNNNNNNKYKIELCDINWLLIEDELEEIMLNNGILNGNEDKVFPSFLNIRIVLQYLINNNLSQLNLSSGNKSYLPGIYDCCSNKDETKQLFIIYKYKNEYKYVTISDMFPLILPNESHLEWFNCRQTTYC